VFPACDCPHSITTDENIESKALSCGEQLNSAMKPFQILLQSRSSSQQSFPDKISMSSKDMKALNVKAGLVMIAFDC
jgi:hypothetical protein